MDNVRKFPLILSSFWLKVIALFTMTIDHIGFMIDGYPGCETLTFVFRHIGRFGSVIDHKRFGIFIKLLCDLIGRSGIAAACSDAETVHELLRFVFRTVPVFLGLAGIPVLDGPVVTRDTRINFGFLAADRTCELLTRQISVILADRICR